MCTTVFEKMFLFLDELNLFRTTFQSWNSVFLSHHFSISIRINQISASANRGKSAKAKKRQQWRGNVRVGTRTTQRHTGVPAFSNFHALGASGVLERGDLEVDLIRTKHTTEECNYRIRINQTNSSLIKFIVNNISPYAFK
jgi:hypothetical protein